MKPVILTGNNNLQVLRTVEDDLRSKCIDYIASKNQSSFNIKYIRRFQPEYSIGKLGCHT